MTAGNSLQIAMAHCSESWREQLRGVCRGLPGPELYKLLSSLVTMSLDAENRRDVSTTDLKGLLNVLGPMLKGVASGSDMDHLSMVTVGVKLLRNLAAGSHDNQICLLEDPALLSSIVNVCECVSTVCVEAGLHLELWKTALQLLGNLCVCCAEGRGRVWQLCSPELFRSALRIGTTDVMNIIYMIIYNCVSGDSGLRLQFCDSSNENSLLGPVLVSLATVADSSEWGEILMGFITGAVPMESLWRCCLHGENPSRQCLMLLQHIQEQVESCRDDGHMGASVAQQPIAPSEAKVPDVDNATVLTVQCTQRGCGLEGKESTPCPSEEDSDSLGNGVPSSALEPPVLPSSGASNSFSSEEALTASVTQPENVSYMEKLFAEHAQCLLSNDAAALIRASHLNKLDDQEDVRLVNVTVMVLKVLCGLFQDEGVLGLVQPNMAVLDSSLALLRQLSVLDGSVSSGKHRTKLSQALPTGNEPSHLFYGFKRDLVCLIANVSYQRPEAQNQVSRLGAVPLILNQCSIDHLNPYISQWSILAIRNLCDGNASVQQVIADLECHGQLDTHKLLEDLGCEVEVGKDGKMKVKGGTAK